MAVRPAAVSVSVQSALGKAAMQRMVVVAVRGRPYFAGREKTGSLTEEVSQMAYLTTHTGTHFSIRPALRGVADFFAGLASGYEANREFQRLDALSDARLAEMGLSRQDLPAYAFRKGLGT